jgi:glycosyltransferase involved in cell wall biosynthesis
LASYASRLNEKVTVLPTVVDTQLYTSPKSDRHPGDGRVVVGWIGSDPNRGDFAGMRPVLDWLGSRYGQRVVLRTVGRRPLEMETSVLQEFVPWSLETSLGELQRFDVGIMPLQDTEWNRGKCGLKLIEYMAVGAAAVASPVGANREIVVHGETGYLAVTVKDWCSQLELLIDDKALRDQMGREGRRRVEQMYSVKSALPVLVRAIASVVSGHRQHEDRTND